MRRERGFLPGGSLSDPYAANPTPRAIASARASRWALGLFALFVVALFAWDPTLGAQGTGESHENLKGTWTNTAGDGGRSAIEHGVDQGIEGMFALGKPTARSRLLGANPPIPTLQIDVSGASVRVDLGHGRNTSAAPGAWQQARSAGGDAIRVRYTVTSSGVLVLESVSDDGSGRHTFHVSEDGRTLRQTVRVESSRLPNDVRYTLTYRRTQ